MMYFQRNPQCLRSIALSLCFVCLFLVGGCGSLWAPTNANPSCDPRIKLNNPKPFLDVPEVWACLRTSRPDGTAIGAVQLVKLTSEGLFYTKSDVSLAQTPPDAAAYTETPVITASRSERGGKILFRLLAYRPLSPAASEQALHDQCTKADADFGCTTTKCWFALSLTRDPANLDQSSCQLTVGQAFQEPSIEPSQEPLKELSQEPLKEPSQEPLREDLVEPLKEGLVEPPQDRPGEVGADLDGGSGEPTKEQGPEPAREVVVDTKDGGSPELPTDMMPREVVPEIPLLPTTTWATRAGGTAIENTWSIAKDLMGNVYVAGTYQGNAYFDGKQLNTFAGATNAFVAKMDSTGKWLWAVGTSGPGASALAIATNKAGEVYIVGKFYARTLFGQFPLTTFQTSPTNKADIFVAKISTGGLFLWAKRAGGKDNDVGDGVAVDASGNIYITGIIKGAAEFNQKQVTTGPQGGIFVSKLDSKGNWIWTAQETSATSVISSSAITLDPSGAPIITGLFYGNVTFDKKLTSGGQADIFVAKLSTNGKTWLWSQRAGGTSICTSVGLATAPNGEIAVVGHFGSGLNSFGTTTLSSKGGDDAFVAKLSATGQWLWAKQVGGVSSNRAKGVVFDSLNDLYVVGSFTEKALFASTTTLTAIPPIPPNKLSGSDVFVFKLDNMGRLLWVKSAGGQKGDTGIGVVLDGKSIITAGSFSDEAAFDQNKLKAAGSFDVFVWKLTLSP